MYCDLGHSLWKELLSLSPNPSDLQKFDLCQAYLVVFERTKKRLVNIKIYISFIIIKIIKYEIFSYSKSFSQIFIHFSYTHILFGNIFHFFLDPIQISIDWNS